MAKIHIYSDANCEIFDFSEYVGYAEKGKDTTIELCRGRHKLRFFNMENCIDSQYVTQVIDADNMVDFIELDFAAIKSNRYATLDELGRIRQEYIDNICRGTGGIIGYDYDDVCRCYFDTNGRLVQIDGDTCCVYKLIKYSHGIFLFETYNGCPSRYVAFNLSLEKVEIDEDLQQKILREFEQERVAKEAAKHKILDRFIVPDLNRTTGKYGFISAYYENPFLPHVDITPILPYVYDAAHEFDYEIATVIYNGEPCIIDKNGKIITDLNSIVPCNELPLVKEDMVQIIAEDRRICFLNHRGQMAIPFKYYAPYCKLNGEFHLFYSGYCIVCTKDAPGNRSMVLIDKQGKVVSPEADFMFHQLRYDIHGFHMKTIARPDIIYAIDNKMGILSYSGKIVIPAEYEDITPFNSYGIAAALKIGDDGRHYLCMINRENRILRMMAVVDDFTVFLDESVAPTAFGFYYRDWDATKEKVYQERIYNHSKLDFVEHTRSDFCTKYGVFDENGISYEVYREDDYCLVNQQPFDLSAPLRSYISQKTANSV